MRTCRSLDTRSGDLRDLAVKLLETSIIQSDSLAAGRYTALLQFSDFSNLKSASVSLFLLHLKTLKLTVLIKV